MFPNLKSKCLKSQNDVLLLTHDLALDDSTSFLSTQTMGSLGRWRLGLFLLFRWWKIKSDRNPNPLGVFISFLSELK